MNPAEWAKIGDKYKNPRERLIYFAKGLRFGEEYQILAWIGIGNAQIVLRDYVQAVNAFQRVLSLKKDNISALIGLGTALFLRGDYQNAIKPIERATELDPENHISWHNLGNVRFALHNRKGALIAFKHSESAYEKIITSNPQDSCAWSMLGQIRRIRGDFQGAINAYRKEIDLNPENVIPYLNLAFVQNENRNFIEAEISFQKVLAIDHTNVNAWRGLVTTYLGLRDNLKALICVERCAALGDPWGKDEIDRIQKLREHQLQLLSTPMHSTWKNKIQRLKGKYTAEEMAYFIEIALLMDMEVRNPTVKKWNRDIKLQVLGMPTHEDINTLNKSIIELNDLIQRIKITLTPEGPNASIRFTPESTFWKFDPTYVPVHFSSFKLCWNSETIYKAEILISTDGVNQAERSHIIRHELTQSLGFMHNSQKEKNSIFYAGMTGSPDFTDLDIYIISLLYRAEIKHGMLESQIKEIISSIDRSP